MTIRRYDTLTSTNTEVARIAGELADGDVVICREQTAGRGQRGNSWEAETGKNLTFSMLLRPHELPAAESFLLSMAVAVGITDALGKILSPKHIQIKWPNDIYWNDKKLAGILIENTISGQFVSHSIIGIGLNVNQRQFVSDAPNPVSMAQIAGKDFVLDDVLDKVVSAIIARSHQPLRDIVAPYHAGLWHGVGRHMWREPAGEPFTASIAEVRPSGHLVLQRADGTLKPYAFKEVSPADFHTR